MSDANEQSVMLAEPAEPKSPSTETNPGTPATAAPAPSGSAVREQVGEAREKLDEVREKAGEYAEQLGEKAGEYAEQVGAATARVAGQVVERLRNSARLPAERGSTTIAHEVVEKVAGIAARQVPGVYDLGGDAARLLASVKERVGLGETEADQGVSVRLEGKDAAINVVLVIEFGFVVYSVTEKVREKVISSVENLLGLEVTEVNIVVDDVHIDESGPLGDDATRARGYDPTTTGITVG